MKKKQRKISYNKELKLWELHCPNNSSVDFVKTKAQAQAWKKRELQEGNCYEVSAKFVLDHKKDFKDLEPVLCHGLVHGQGPLQGAIFGHGWVEYPSINTALDKSNGRDLEVPIDVYYKLGKINPTNVKKYTTKEIRKKIVEHGHWGPW